jgi:hypothetical protein
MLALWSDRSDSNSYRIDNIDHVQPRPECSSFDRRIGAMSSRCSDRERQRFRQIFIPTEASRMETKSCAEQQGRSPGLMNGGKLRRGATMFRNV